MKTLLLLRHAKSSWDDRSLPDFQRPLAPRGMRAAPTVGAYLASHGLVPDRVLCSAARRATETWSLVSGELGPEIPVEFREDLYHASVGSLLALVRGQPDDATSIVLVGHNPTLEDLAFTLAGGGDERALATMERKFPTGALAVVDFPVRRWGEIQAGDGSLRLFLRPKDLS